jgi:CPA2 family monovalent cation:H+ antiporter-2
MILCNADEEGNRVVKVEGINMTQIVIFELGIILVLSYFSAIIVKKIKQPLIIGYILVGIIIGPNGINLVKNVDILELFSEIGIILLMFFLGIEFSINKFSNTKNSVVFIGTFEVVLNLVVGYAIGTIVGSFYGFTQIETLFFACITALSSSGVVGKLIVELKRTASKESEILMGVMIYEDFLAVVLLGVLSTIAIKDHFNIVDSLFPAAKALVFYGVFFAVGIFIIHKLIDYLAKIESQELFTSLTLGTVMVTATIAASIGLSPAAGGFLLGMVITSYDVEQRLHRTISGFKDIFITVFFVSFGMNLDVTKILGLWSLILIFVPLSIIFEIIISSSAAYISGFSPQKAVNIGTSMVARGEYSMIFATIGLTAGAISENLYQFTGIYVLLMTLLTPITMKNSQKITKLFSFVIPEFIKFGGKVFADTLRPVIMPEIFSIHPKREFKFAGGFLLYIIILGLAYSVEISWLFFVIIFIELWVIVAIFFILKGKIQANENLIKYTYRDKEIRNKKLIFGFINLNFCVVLTGVLATLIMSKIANSIAIYIPLIIFVAFLLTSTYILYKSICSIHKAGVEE